MAKRRFYKPFARRNLPHSLRMESLEPRFVLDSTVVFNEIMYHSLGENEPLEWVELHNQMAVKMDVSGWRLANGIDYTFPNGTVVDGGGYLVVANRPTEFADARGLDNVLGPFVGRLSNTGERIELVDRNDREMDVIDYNDRNEWPVGPDGSGSTLAKLSPQSSSAAVRNWGTSEQTGGTPGAENFFVEKVTRVSVNPIQLGDGALVNIPTDESLAFRFRDSDYSPGMLGEEWIVGPTPIGFEAVGDAPSYEETVLADDPVAYWRLSESDVGEPARNLGSAGNAADGTYDDRADLGRESLVHASDDKAIALALTRFDTTVLTSEFEKFENGSGRTIEFWLQLERDSTATASLVGDADSNSDYGHMVYITSDNVIRTHFQTSEGTAQIDSVAPINVGEVVHVVSTWDATTGPRD